MAEPINVRQLSVPQLTRLINTSAGRAVVHDRRIRRHRERSGYTIGDDRTVDLLRYAAWLTLEVCKPPKPAKNTDYEAMKESARARNADASLSGRDIGEIPPVENPKRRKAGEQSFRIFCETYFPETFCLEWSEDHLRVIAKMERAVLHGELFALAMPRGSGKSSLCEAATIWAILIGACRFVALIAATAGHAKESLESIKTEFEANDQLAADFPEAVFPIQALERIHNRAKGQLCCGKPTRISWTADEIVMPTVDGSNASGAVIRVAGIEGRIRGMKHKRADGKAVRPDLVILDDPQTDESARSDDQTRVRVRTLNGAVLGLAGPGQKIRGIMPCTVIQQDDMADQILDRSKNPRWQGERTKLVYEFPVNEKLWEQYEKIRNDSFASDGDGAEATEFYRQNRKAMDAGAVAAWPARHEPDELSAIQNAMNLKIDDEESFFAEYQNEPIVEQVGEAQLTAQQIMEKTNGHNAGVIPIGCDHLTMFIDVQQAALYWLMAAWESNFTGYIIDYGTWPEQGRRHFTLRNIRKTIQKEKSDAGLEGQLYYAMERLADEKLSCAYRRDDGAEMRIDRCLIDANWGESTDVVYQFCRQSQYSGVLLPSHGKYVGASSTPFADYRRKKGDRCGHHWRIPNVQGRRPVRYALVDTNYWKSFVHSRLAVSMGDAGCLSLCGQDSKRHELLAEHLTAEYRVKTQAKEREVDEWKLHKNRPDNHWFDCLVGASVAASIEGVKLAGLPDSGGAKRTRRKYTQDDLRRDHG